MSIPRCAWPRSREEIGPSIGRFDFEWGRCSSTFLIRVPSSCLTFRSRLPTTTSVTSDTSHENDVDAKSQGLMKVDHLDGYYITTPISRRFKQICSFHPVCCPQGILKVDHEPSQSRCTPVPIGTCLIRYFREWVSTSRSTSTAARSCFLRTLGESDGSAPVAFEGWLRSRVCRCTPSLGHSLPGK